MAEAESSTGGFPWGSVAVILAFVASTQLVPHAFDALRPPETERAQAPALKDLPVDARLWEDPFSALRRYEAERDERCAKLGKDSPAYKDCRELSDSAEPDSLLPKAMMKAWLEEDLPQAAASPASTSASATAPTGPQTLLLAVMVPGNPFVGAEESRRRTRYAVLSGLMTAGYVPGDSEHMGVMSVEQRSLRSRIIAKDSDKLNEHTRLRFDMPFETLGADKTSTLRVGDIGRYKRVLLVWINESSLPQPRMDALALLMTQFYKTWTGGAEPDLALIGPSSTDALHAALADLRDVEKRTRDFAIGSSRSSKENALKTGYTHLARARFLNSASTASETYLPELDGLTLDEFLKLKLGAASGTTPPRSLMFQRTIAMDNKVLDALVEELKLRLSHSHGRRVVLVTEFDSSYARALLHYMNGKLAERFRGVSVEPAYYFRGLDGVTTRDSSTQALQQQPQGGKSDKPTDDEDAALKIEWPEARDQLDYLRRLSESLKDSDKDPELGPIAAIGVMGFDVHDKLLVLQALHEGFADRIFFTTDMDARLLHPRVLDFTRNLIVASSLPLEMPKSVAARDPAASGPQLRFAGAHFRDVYQSSAFLAARQASCATDGCRATGTKDIDEQLAKTLTYEIGRTQALDLDAKPPDFVMGRADKGYGLVAGLLTAFLILAFTFWPSTPSLRALRGALVHFTEEEGRASSKPPRLAGITLAMASLQLLILVYTGASLMAFLHKGIFGESVLLSVLCVQLALLALLPLAWLGLKCFLRWRVSKDRTHKRVAALARLQGIVERSQPISGRVYFVSIFTAAFLALLLVWLTQGTHEQGGEPLAWFEGVSAWPSHLLHLIALASLAWSVDTTLDRMLHSLDADTHWLCMPRDKGSTARPNGWEWLNHVSVVRWIRPGDESCNMLLLWQEYRRRAAGRPKALRILGFLLLSGIVAALLWHGLTPGRQSFIDSLLVSRMFDVPVRGIYHQNLVILTLVPILLLLPLSIVALADGTLLAYRFVVHLDAGRSWYPDEVLRHFATKLGDTGRKPLWTRRVSLEPHGRTRENKRNLKHSLLDDWIDMQLVARRTSHISPLVIGPFLALGIMLLARSRIFDNWSMTLAIALTASAYLLILIVLSVLLKQAVESTRVHALEHMAADLRWLQGQSGSMHELVEPFKGLMDEVRNMRAGAFADRFDQPLIKAMLIPLGGAGGAKILDYLSTMH